MTKVLIYKTEAFQTRPVDLIGFSEFNWSRLKKYDKVRHQTSPLRNVAAGRREAPEFPGRIVPQLSYRKFTDSYISIGWRYIARKGSYYS